MLRVFLLLLLLAPGVSVRAAETEPELFQAASKALHDKFFERADQQFGEFLARFPNSTNTAAAALGEAQARFYQKNFGGAIDLLHAHLAKAGSLTDQYLYWEAQALAGRGDFTKAAATYARILKEFPRSALRADAAYQQAFSFFQNTNYTGTVELLRQTGAAANLTNSAGIAARSGLLEAEALLALRRVNEARKAATAVGPGNDSELQWQRWDLLARIELAAQKPAEALALNTNALAAAGTNASPRLLAQSLNLEAEVYRKLSQTGDAVRAYEQIAALKDLPLDQRRLAMLKSVELLSATGALTNALARIETYLSVNTNEPAADLLRVKASELWIDQFRALTSRGKPLSPARLAAATNALAQARAHLATVQSVFTNSVYLGRAWLNMGWTWWEEGSFFDNPESIQRSEAAFRKASETLTRSDDQARAIFKMADAELFLNQPRQAMTNYLKVLRNYNDLPQVQNALFEQACRSLVRASIEAGDLGSAAAYVTEMRAAFPGSPATEETMFALGKSFARAGRAADARAVFEDFVKSYPASPLVPEVRLAEARVLADEGKWKDGLALCDQWLTANTNHALRAEVEFQRAMILDKAGEHTNALTQLTNFVTRFPTNSLAVAAQNWVADYYWDQEQWLLAEQNYQHVFQNTNWSGDPLTFRAMMMAAKTAFRRQGYSDARSYLTNLYNDPKCPPELRPEALFELGDVTLAEPITGTTNALNNFIQAANTFDLIINQYSNAAPKLAVLAWGKKGDCLFQIASYPNNYAVYSEATNAYLKVLDSKLPDLPVAARNQAEVGIALVLKAMAENASGPEHDALLKAARDRLLNVAYGTNSAGRRPDPFYVKKAGLEAGRITESLGETEAAIELYRRLAKEAPSMKSIWDARVASLQQQLAARAN